MYKRVLLKLSGEVFAGGKDFGIKEDVLNYVAGEIKEIKLTYPELEIAVIVGGGNIWRGRKALGGQIDQSTADHMGMLATVINALALQGFLEKEGLATRVQTAFEMRSIAEPFILRRALRHLGKGRIVIFAGGTGNPYFTTDTAAALRSLEINADAILKATKVDGVFDADPFKNPSAVKFKEISYQEVLKRELKVMDFTAISLCMDYKMPIVVFNLTQSGNIKKIIQGEEVGTIVKNNL